MPHIRTNTYLRTSSTTWRVYVDVQTVGASFIVHGRTAQVMTLTTRDDEYMARREAPRAGGHTTVAANGHARSSASTAAAADTRRNTTP